MPPTGAGYIPLQGIERTSASEGVSRMWMSACSKSRNCTTSGKVAPEPGKAWIGEAVSRTAFCHVYPEFLPPTEPGKLAVNMHRHLSLSKLPNCLGRIMGVAISPDSGLFVGSKESGEIPSNFRRAGAYRAPPHRQTGRIRLRASRVLIHKIRSEAGSEYLSWRFSDCHCIITT